VLLGSGERPDWRRATLAELMWPGSAERNRQHSLRQVLCEVRKKLGPTAIEESPEALRLAADRWWVDFVQFEKAVSAARWDEAADLYEGPFAAVGGSHEALELRARLDGVQARLHVKAAHCFVRLISRAVAEGDLAAAEQWARTYVAMDPLGEQARRLLMQVLHAEHQDTDALGVFEEYRTYLDRLIGDDPSVGLYGLANEIVKATKGVQRPERRKAPREVRVERRRTRGRYATH
jgi:DNA-binding SARP family transcriptional activator